MGNKYNPRREVRVSKKARDFIARDIGEFHSDDMRKVDRRAPPKEREHENVRRNKRWDFDDDE